MLGVGARGVRSEARSSRAIPPACYSMMLVRWPRKTMSAVTCEYKTSLRAETKEAGLTASESRVSGFHFYLLVHQPLTQVLAVFLLHGSLR
jgi:hypothetical protein